MAPPIYQESQTTTSKPPLPFRCEWQQYQKRKWCATTRRMVRHLLTHVSSNCCTCNRKVLRRWKSIQATALRNRVNTGQSGGTIGRRRTKILTVPQRTGFQPLPIAVQRSMDIRRSPLSFDGYTATTPTAVTLSDFAYWKIFVMISTMLFYS